MSAWQVGDLAVCVDVGVQHTVFIHVGSGLRLGATYRVEAIGEPSMAGLPTLILSHVGRKFANRFRKVLPDKHEACEAEFVTLLKRSKRKAPALLEDEGSCREVTKQIREWREEDRRAGIIWSDEL